MLVCWGVVCVLDWDFGVVSGGLVAVLGVVGRSGGGWFWFRWW